MVLYLFAIIWQECMVREREREHECVVLYIHRQKLPTSPGLIHFMALHLKFNEFKRTCLQNALQTLGKWSREKEREWKTRRERETYTMSNQIEECELVSTISFSLLYAMLWCFLTVCFFLPLFHSFVRSFFLFRFHFGLFISTAWLWEH